MNILKEFTEFSLKVKFQSDRVFSDWAKVKKLNDNKHEYNCTTGIPCIGKSYALISKSRYIHENHLHNEHFLISKVEK